MPNINPHGRPPRLPPQPPPPPPPIQFENRTPESFGRNGFVNTTPASQPPNPHQAPVNPAFINTTARDFQPPIEQLPPRPELRIDTNVGGGRPVGEGDTTISAYSDASGRRAPMHPGLAGSSSGYPGSGASNLSGMDSPLDPFRFASPPTPNTLPSLSSPGSSATQPNSPFTPRVALSEDGRIYDSDSPSRLISRSPSMEIPEPPTFTGNYPVPISRVPSSPHSRSTAPSPSVPSPQAAATSASSESTPVAPTQTQSPASWNAPTPGYAPTPGGWESPGSYGYAPTPQAYRSPSLYDSNPPTPGVAPTPGGYLSPTPGMEAAADTLISMQATPAAPLSHAPTPRAVDSGGATPRAPETP